MCLKVSIFIKPPNIKMSARKPSKSNSGNSSSLRTAAGPHGKSSVPGVVPRKRARDESLSEEEKSSSEESSKRVETLRDDDTDLRVSSGANPKRTPSGFSEKRQKTSDESDKKRRAVIDSSQSDEDAVLESTASQQQPIKLTETSAHRQAQNKAQMTSYLNAESIKALEKGALSRPLELQTFIKQMIEAETAQTSNLGAMLHSRKPQLNIEMLQNRGTPHLLRNKVSDKFERRDVQFYDLYVKKDAEEDLARLRDSGHQMEIGAGQYYRDMEVDDFNRLFRHDKYIAEKFGSTIKVTLDVSSGGKGTRFVRENQELVKMKDDSKDSPSKLQDQLDDLDLITLDSSLKQFEKEFGRTPDEIADIFCRVSGRLHKMRDFLEGKPVVDWNYLEDLALTKPEDSAEFQVLLQTKGWEEIQVRREFLQATPVVDEEQPKEPGNGLK